MTNNFFELTHLSAELMAEGVLYLDGQSVGAVVPVRSDRLNDVMKRYILLLVPASTCPRSAVSPS